MPADRVERFLLALEAWAVDRDDVHAAVVVGSQARSDLPPDQFADVDVLLVVDALGPFLDDTRWLHAFGTPVLTFLEPTAVGGQTERRVLYDDGQDVNFAVAPLSDAVVPAAAGRMLTRGFRMVVDEIGLEERLRAAAAEAAGAEAPPTRAEFEQAVHGPSATASLPENRMAMRARRVARASFAHGVPPSVHPRTGRAGTPVGRRPVQRR